MQDYAVQDQRRGWEQGPTSNRSAHLRVLGFHRLPPASTTQGNAVSAPLIWAKQESYKTVQNASALCSKYSPQPGLWIVGWRVHPRHMSPFWLKARLTRTPSLGLGAVQLILPHAMAPPIIPRTPPTPASVVIDFQLGIEAPLNIESQG